MRWPEKDKYAWRLWFAWYPVHVARPADKGGAKYTVWLENVWCRTQYEGLVTLYEYALREEFYG